ncbi:MAG: cytochrome c3 family protein, partial [Deltaproteobacteria bacterium]
MQKLPVILTGVILIGVIAVGGVIAGDAEDTLCIPMGTLLIEPPDGVEAKRSPVDFPHSIHFDYTCKTCHHTWDGENPILSCTTSGCHDLTSVRSDDGKLEPDLLVRNF